MGVVQNAALPRFSGYDDSRWIEQQVRQGLHREVIGGLWEELGSLQLAFLVAQGLQPQHALIDIGAGSFRAGVKLIPYLDPGNYCAVDSQISLLDAGYRREIEPARLGMRFPRANYAATAQFHLADFARFFDFGLAQSVFTHMPLTRLVDCLHATAPYFRAGAAFYVTVFMAAEEEAMAPVTQFPGIVTFPDREPFHVTEKALADMAAHVPMWRMQVIGDWCHPRHQKMLRFERL